MDNMNNMNNMDNMNLKPSPEVNMNSNVVVPTVPTGATEAATTTSAKAVHQSANCGDDVKVNVNSNIKRKNNNNKKPDVVKNSQVRNSNCDTSG